MGGNLKIVGRPHRARLTVREADSKLAAINVSGPLTIAGGTVKGSGSLKASQTRTY